MEKVLIIYMVILGGYTVWCFWWGMGNVKKSVKNNGERRKKRIGWGGIPGCWYSDYGVPKMRNPPPPPPLKELGTMATDRTGWVDDVLPASEVNKEILNEYWKNTQK